MPGKRNIYLGVDPGASGAWALYCPDDGSLAVEDMPVHEILGKKRIDIYKLAAFIDAWAEADRIVRATVESVHAMPKQGVSSSFNFGFAAGAIQQAIACNSLPLVLVTPQAWKKLYKIGADKDEARRAASMLFPRHAHLWARKKDDGRAESALIAHYGSKLQ